LSDELKELRSLVGEFNSAKETREYVESLEAKKILNKKEIRGYQRVIGDFKAAKDLGDHVKNLRKLVGDFKNANELQSHSKMLNDEVSAKKRLLASYFSKLATILRTSLACSPSM